MDTKRIEKVIAKMKEASMNRLLLTDPMAIYYLTGKWLMPGERMYGLLLSTDGEHRMIINVLFPDHDNLDIPILWYSDTQDAMELLSSYIKDGTVGIDKNMPARFLLRLMQLTPKAAMINGSFVVDAARRIKDEEEAKRMRTVSLLNDQVMGQLIQTGVLGKTELEMAALCEKLQKEAGCETVSFEPIIAFGANAADPHHGNDQSVAKPGDSIIFDIGGRKDSYCSDMTRTVFLGSVSEEARTVYEIVKEANKRGIEAVKPGVRFCDVDHAVRSYIEEKGYGPYFTHRTGHNIGLECHEAGDVSAANQDILKPGMCFSIEPGIYIPGQFGVRIEDLVLVTEDGCEVLNHYSKDLQILPLSV